MKMAIDFRGFKINGAGGLSLYSELLLKYLLKNKCKILILATKGIKITDLKINKNEYKNITLINLNTNSARANKENLNIDSKEIPKIISEHNVDIFHACANHGTSSKKIVVPKILTVHDIIPFSIREGAAVDSKNYLIYKKIIKNSIINTDKIVSISKYTKDRIIDKFKIKSKKIQVIYNGGYIGYAERQMLSIKGGNKYLNKFELRQKKYFIYIGGFYERKNLIRLVTAFKIIYKKYPNYKLVVTGDNKHNSYSKKQYKKYLKKVNDCKGIKFLGYVSEREKKYLIKNAKGLVYPSIYEGFGLPIIEAMSLGTPVLCSNNTVLPEIGRKIPFYFDPFKTEDIVNKLEGLINQKKAILDEKINNGIKRSKLFTWDRCFSKLYSLYKKEINEKPLVSIVMPVYNRQNFVKKSIRSILNQTYKNFELIIVDDGSTDRTSKIIKSFNDNRIRYFYHKNKGEYYSTNIGLKKAQGKYITWVHSDDQIPLESLANRVSILNLDKSVDLVHGNIYKIKLSNKSKEKLIALNCDSKKVLKYYCWDEKYRTQKKYYIHHLTFMFRKSILDRVGYFNEKNGNFGGDLDWMIRMLKCCKIKKIDKILYHYCRHKKTVSYIMQNKEDTKRITKQIQEKYCKKILFTNG